MSKIYFEALKQNMVTVMKGAQIILSAASVIHPIFGVAGSVMKLTLDIVNDEDIQTLKREFSLANTELDKLSVENRKTLENIRKFTSDTQYWQVEQRLRNQYHMFMEMVNAQPEHIESKKDDFKRSYAKELGDQNLHSLYKGVVGPAMLFSTSILEVYLEYSHGNRRTLEDLNMRLNHLFLIGLMALISYTIIMKLSPDEIIKEWTEKMENVQKKMQEALEKCG